MAEIHNYFLKDGTRLALPRGWMAKGGKLIPFIHSHSDSKLALGFLKRNLLAEGITELGPLELNDNLA